MKRQSSTVLPQVEPIAGDRSPARSVSLSETQQFLFRLAVEIFGGDLKNPNPIVPRLRGRPRGGVPLVRDRQRHLLVVMEVILRLGDHFRKHPIAQGVLTLFDPRCAIWSSSGSGAPITIVAPQNASCVESRQKTLVVKHARIRDGLPSASTVDRAADLAWFYQSVTIIEAFLKGGSDDAIRSSDGWMALLPGLVMIRDALTSSHRKIIQVGIYSELRVASNGINLRANEERGRPMRMAFQIDEVSWMASLPRATVDEAVRTGALVVREAGGHQVVLTTDLQNFMDGLPPVRTAKAKSTKDRK